MKWWKRWRSRIFGSSPANQPVPPPAPPEDDLPLPRTADISSDLPRTISSGVSSEQVTPTPTWTVSTLVAGPNYRNKRYDRCVKSRSPLVFLSADNKALSVVLNSDGTTQLTEEGRLGNTDDHMRIVAAHSAWCYDKYVFGRVAFSQDVVEFNVPDRFNTEPDYFKPMYNKPYMRVGPYYVSMLVGYVLWRATRNGKRVKINKVCSNKNLYENMRDATAPYQSKSLCFSRRGLLFAVCALAYFQQTTEACSEVTTMTAQRSVCTVTKDGNLECMLTETTRLALMPQGQDACLLIRDPNGETLGTLALEVEKITLDCTPRNRFFTRSFSMKVESAKRCSQAGSCKGKKCRGVKIDTKIDELDGEPNDSPGFTRCAESCGCASCGCFLCDAACLFYRVYAVPVTDVVYEAFDCPTWQFTVRITARINLQGTTQSHKFELKPGVSVDWNNIKLTLASVSTPPIPILSSHFLTDGKKTVLIGSSHSGQPVSGTIGELQCANYEKAKKFLCYIAHDACTCHPQERTVGCSCADRKLEPLFEDIERLIPMQTSGLSIIGSGTNLQAEFNEIGSLEVQVSLEGFRLAAKVEKNTCTITPIEFGGCYNCLSGSRLEFTCKTDFGEAVAHVRCLNNGMQASFSTICTPSGITAKAVMAFQHAMVNAKCIVSCPAGDSSFHIEGTLVFVEKDRLGHVTNVVGSRVINSGVDFGLFTNWLYKNWLSSVCLVLIFIILIKLTCACGSKCNLKN